MEIADYRNYSQRATPSVDEGNKITDFTKANYSITNYIIVRTLYALLCTCRLLKT